ncbi:MAG: PulJ/GspJ family protein [Cellvibrionaceae bacterium]
MLTTKKFYIHNQSQTGFTLIELITVVVILSILTVIGSGFMIRTAEGYHQTVNRTQLIQRGRQTIERLTRELRNAVPNSIRVSANNLCIEWLPIVGGGNYVGVLPDQSNGASSVTTMNTGPLSFGSGNTAYVIVGALSSNDIYNASPNSLELFSSIDTSNIPNVITLSNPKIFERNSVNNRIFIASEPNQACISGDQLFTYDNYTSAGNYPSQSVLTGSPPGTGVLLSVGVSLSGEIPFSITSGSLDRNTIVQLNIPFEKGGERIALSHQIMVRNVP